MKRERLVVLDFGSQYAHLIAKRLRLLGYYTEVVSPTVKTRELVDAKGIILSGGPASLSDENAPEFNRKILSCPQLMYIPTLGICYGHYLIAQEFGGEVGPAKTGEYGLATLEIRGKECPLFTGIPKKTPVWMSHMDQVLSAPEGFTVASTKDCACAAFYRQSETRPFFSVQFHPEVADTPYGQQILENFASLICGMKKNWNPDEVLGEILEDIKTEAEGKNVMLFLSGGVDSTVTFALLNQALGKKRVMGLHIDNGFMRANESKKVADSYLALGYDNFISYDAAEDFLMVVKGLIDPQDKRKAIGDYFVRVKDRAAAEYELDSYMLAQGTLYPDVIESGGTKNSHVIKTHHNRSPKILELQEKGLLLEPLKDLYKDEVRKIGEALGLPHDMVWRHPFPGPGLAINVLCSDGKVPEEELKAAEAELKQALAAYAQDHWWNAKDDEDLEVSLLPVKSTGVQGDQRTYGFPAVLDYGRITDDGEHFLPPWEELEARSVSITNNCKSINRCVVTLFQRTTDGPAPQDVKLKLRRDFLTRERLNQTRGVDQVVLSTLRQASLYDEIFQHLTINLPYSSKKGHCSIVLRPVVSEDVMTARFARLPGPWLDLIVAKITGWYPFVDAIYYDVTNKPPATFGWE